MPRANGITVDISRGDLWCNLVYASCATTGAPSQAFRTLFVQETIELRLGGDVVRDQSELTVMTRSTKRSMRSMPAGGVP